VTPICWPGSTLYSDGVQGSIGGENRDSFFGRSNKKLSTAARKHMKMWTMLSLSAVGARDWGL
jgi:hypothetical protein